MPRGYRPPWTAAAGFAVAALLLGGAPARGQTKVPTDSHWSLDDPRGGFCIWYLVDPALAPRLVGGGTTFTPASSSPGLPGPLTEIVHSEPKFAEWIPAVLCVGFYGSVQIDGTVAAKARGSRSVTMVLSAIAAQTPHQVAGAQFYLMGLQSDQRPIARAAENVGFEVGGDVSISGHDRGQGADPDLIIRLGSMDLVWNGHLYGEASVGKTRSMSFGYGGLRTTIWSLDLESTPATTQALVGALRVEGRGDLEKALAASPIRYLSPQERGGSVRLVFQRVTRK